MEEWWTSWKRVSKPNIECGRIKGIFHWRVRVRLCDVSEHQLVSGERASVGGVLQLFVFLDASQMFPSVINDWMMRWDVVAKVRWSSLHIVKTFFRSDDEHMCTLTVPSEVWSGIPLATAWRSCTLEGACSVFLRVALPLHVIAQFKIASSMQLHEKWCSYDMGSHSAVFWMTTHWAFCHGSIYLSEQ